MANGLRATFPHTLGTGAGFALVIVLVGLGVAGMIAAHAMLRTGMRWASMAWLGVSAARFLGHCPRPRGFNIAMAVLLVSSMLPIALEG